jgi:hypothetical protein
MSDLYWWSRYGNFSPGIGTLPHMGEVLGIDALKATRAAQSQKGEAQVRSLYFDLKTLDEHNPYVHNLGVELGIF